MLRGELVALGCPDPGHELIDARGGPQVDEFGQHVGEISLWIDVVQFACFDERSDARPVFCSMIVAGEECVFAIEYDRADAAFDDIGVKLDAAIFKKAAESVPMV